MDPTQKDSQARALAATRRVLAVMRLEASGDEGALSETDRELLEGYEAAQLTEDLRTFAEWHEALGTDPEVALAEMRSRIEGGSPD